ncbi:MAG TPA: dethiobiotin synthase [Verrucomicrobiae bacterium]|nr:dethiobiotin synthase [Verrucomicrobiae bacterium]
MRAKILFITGTDTGVGKTLLTSLLLCHLRSRGAGAFALKPFCSGGRADAELLHQLQEGDLSLDEINPFYFPEPIAPLISARKHKRPVPLERALDHITRLASRVPDASVASNPRSKIKNSNLRIKNFLLIEGSGGLLVPLGENYTVRDLIVRLGCDVLLVCPNKLGTINHTLLTLSSLGVWPGRGPRSGLRWPRSVKLVVMDQRSPDFSSRTNPAILRELIHPRTLVQVPFLEQNCLSVASVQRAAVKLRTVLSKLVSSG